MKHTFITAYDKASRVSGEFLAFEIEALGVPVQKIETASGGMILIYTYKRP